MLLLRQHVMRSGGLGMNVCEELPFAFVRRREEALPALPKVQRACCNVQVTLLLLLLLLLRNHSPVGSFAHPTSSTTMAKEL